MPVKHRQTIKNTKTRKAPYNQLQKQKSLKMGTRLFITGIACMMIITQEAAMAQDHAPLPKNYIVYKTLNELTIDGRMDEPEWQHTIWTDYFVDIEGDKITKPHLKTRVKMLWDNNYLYIAAELEEPNIWATFTQRESIIFHENNFEVFIDPSGDTHNYYELEINALGTTWDLMLTKPYRFFGIPVTAWDIDGLKKGIQINGTINEPSDTDISWTVELALPMKILMECSLGMRPPLAGEQWRINFSRVEWQLVNKNGAYHKKINPETSKPFPEYNWVWSPQGVIEMHRPELWGIIQFSDQLPGHGTDMFIPDPDEDIRLLLREIFNAQHKYFDKHNRFASSLEELKLSGINAMPKKIDFESGKTRFKVSIKSNKTKFEWHIIEDSKIWKE